MENISAKGGLESSCHLLPKNVHSKLVNITKKTKKIRSHQEENILLSVGQLLRPLEVFKQNQPVYMWGAVLEFLLFMAELQQQVCLKGT